MMPAASRKATFEAAQPPTRTSNLVWADAPGNVLLKARTTVLAR